MLLLTSGTYTVSGTAVEVPPPGAGVVTVMAPLPCTARVAAGIVSESDVLPIVTGTAFEIAAAVGVEIVTLAVPVLPSRSAETLPMSV